MLSLKEGSDFLLILMEQEKEFSPLEILLSEKVLILEDYWGNNEKIAFYRILSYICHYLTLEIER